MSQSPLASTSSSNLEFTFRTAFKAYKKRTGQDITSHLLAIWLKTCDSPDAIIAVLRAQVQEFDQSRRDDERLTKWLNPTVNVLYAFSATLGGLMFSPAKVVFAGIGVLLLTSKDVTASHDVLIDIFERIENFFKRLEAYTEVPQTAAMTDIIVKIMVEVLSILAITTEVIKQGQAKKFLNRLIGRRDIEDALQRLDRLTQEEAWMATAEVLRLTQNVDDKVNGIGSQVEGVNKGVQGVDGKVEDVDERVQGVGHEVQGVDDRAKLVDDRVGVVNDNVKLILDGGNERSAAIKRIVNNVDYMSLNPDGYIANMFGPRDAEAYYCTLLRREPRLLQPYNLAGYPGIFFAVPPLRPDLDSRQQQTPWVVDYTVLNQGTVIKQQMWVPQIQHEFLRPPIFFVHNNGGLGLPLNQAAGGDCMSLQGASQPAPLGANCTTHVLIRINWCGYSPWDYPLMIRTQAQGEGIIRLEKFVKYLAKKVQKFMVEEGRRAYNNSEHRWIIGAGGITSNNVVLIGVVQVSQGSWMPILQLNRFVL